MAQANSQMNIPAKLAINGVKYLSNVWVRRPYFGEIITNNILKVAVSVLFEGPLKSLTKNGNPTTESVVRDGLMSPGVLINVYNKQPIKQDYTYDVFSIVGTGVRGGGKVFFINSANYISAGLNYTLSPLNYNGVFNETLEAVNNDKVAFAARVGNVVMEPLSMLFNIIIPKDRQAKMPDGSDNTHISWYIYMFSNFNSDWIVLASLGAVGRAFVPDQMGETYRWLKGFKFIQNPANQLYKMKNNVIENIFSIDPINISEDVMGQIGKARNQIMSLEENVKVAEAKADVASIAMFSLAFLLKLPEQLFQAYLIMIPTREAFDWISGELNDGYENIAKPMIDSLGKEKLLGFNNHNEINSVFQALSIMVSDNKMKSVEALSKLKMFLMSNLKTKSVIKDICSSALNSNSEDVANAIKDIARLDFKKKDAYIPSGLDFKAIKSYISNNANSADIKGFFKEASNLKLGHQIHVLVKIGGVLAAYNMVKMLVSPFASVIKGASDATYLYAEDKASDAYEWSSNIVKDTSAYSFFEGKVTMVSSVIYNFIPSNSLEFVDYYLNAKHFVADKVFSYQVAVDSYNWMFQENGKLDAMVIDSSLRLESDIIPSVNESCSVDQDIMLDACEGEFCIEEIGRVSEQEL